MNLAKEVIRTVAQWGAQVRSGGQKPQVDR
jgi:hypothetical protein